MNVRVHGKARHAKCLRHDNLCRFMADPRQPLQRLKISWHFAFMLFQQNLRQTADRFRFLRTQSTWAHDRLDFLHLPPGQILRPFLLLLLREPNESFSRGSCR